MPSRRKARECALQMLFQWDLGRHNPEIVQELFWSNTRPDEDEALRSFANQLFEGVESNIEEIDHLIRTYTEGWSLERMPVVDRNVLRLGIYELLHHPEAPPAVAINEALEIARKYSGEDAVLFLNGILDRIRKEDINARPA
ncbi:MAG: transcription antitermination factor NusB [Acidobacteria bacterium]|nr:transcription antitermination factor NusB [Acidobacteriota bacterium]